MESKTLEALKGSIKKWAGILAGTVKDKGADNCPLCELFYDSDDTPREDQCKGCPVFEKTKHQWCGNTPYTGWSFAQSDHKGTMGFADTEIKKKWAKAELDFLLDLLPPEEKENALKDMLK